MSVKVPAIVVGIGATRSIIGGISAKREWTISNSGKRAGGPASESHKTMPPFRVAFSAVQTRSDNFLASYAVEDN